MKKIILIGSIIIFVALSYILSNSVQKREQALPKGNSVLSAVISPSPIQKESGIPKSIQIPAINVAADIEQVGLDSKKNMDVPKEAQNAGWYKYGTRPGNRGNAVLAGHLDKADGTPAVFYDLKKLEVGDSIIIENDKNQRYTYVVTKTENYPYNRFPLEGVFGSTDKYQLNLITCDGVFDKNSKNYSERTVVYAELAK